MAGLGEGRRQKDGLALGAPAAKVVLDDKNFHCSAEIRGKSLANHSMNKAFVNLLVRWMVLAQGVALSTKLVPGIKCDEGLTLAVLVQLLSFFNEVLKPLLMLFTLPFIVLTLGLGIWLINALLFYFVARLVDGFHVAGFGSALLGALIVSLTSMIMNSIMRPPPKPPAGPPAGGKREDVIDI